ncbi:MULTISPECIES: DUF4241 domain-containing protein [Bacillus]|uniref:DUF4241 domain-containing protein n=1 Tax=Bacillus TaxID=1386 RepID=UPI0009BD6BA3|nr:DUF4241 domain-containing protein [Bacillus pumilus DW2J2]MBR0616371.1 DUF4241 domain-containing protein [Bacillus pumilus]PSB71880.1 DUF4241 domain-containing protein [Bacillus sp. LNXM12-1]PSB75772.1 DUF4241 domain-containing protein [Bacillus sp. LNXM12-2]MBR0619977.1 DUF4241 domain-containing protein [Bacillus pumilus]
MAYAIIKFSSKSSVKWEPALSNGQIESDLQGEQFSGYGVDTENGCFMDDHALKYIYFPNKVKTLKMTYMMNLKRY